jgi:Flp pilus assembly pilin Flp
MDGHQYFLAQGLVEYAMILIIVAVLIVVLVYVLGGSIGDLYSNIIATV